MHDWVGRHKDFWRARHDAMDEQEAFLDGDRYVDDTGEFNRDRRLIQIRGEEIADTIRHDIAEATARPRNVEPRPIDRDDDPEGGEAVASLVDLELGNPWKGFEDYYEEAIGSAKEKQLGVVWMDWEPPAPKGQGGKFGEILYSFNDPRNFMWDEAYDPHHPLCDVLVRRKRVDVDKARKQYKAKWLQPDRAYNNVAGFGGGTKANGHWTSPVSTDDNKVEIWECWYKNDHTTKTVEKSSETLPDDQQYLACTLGCGYRGDPGEGMPEMVPQGCPTCGGDMERVDEIARDETSLMFERGRRLTVIAPWSPNPNGKEELYDGKWPIPRARSFPALFITAEAKGGRPFGKSTTQHHWDQQIASDTLRTTALQRVLEHRNYWEIPREGLVDFRNQRFEFRDDQFNVMFRDASKEQFGRVPVELHNGSGLDPAFAQVFNITQAALTQYRGVADLGLTPESSKDIAVGTIDTMVQQGNIQSAHFNRRKNRALGKFYGVVSDYIAATYTHARLSRLNIDGVDVLLRVFAADLPMFDFTITDSEPFTGVEKARAESARSLIQAANEAPDWWDIIAEMEGHPPSIIRKIEKRMEEIRMKDEMMAPPMDEGLPPEMAGDDMGTGMVPELSSPNGAGMIQ